MQFSITKGSSEMSHDYYFTRDNTATGERVDTVGLSNISHYDWQMKAGLSRTMHNMETGETEAWLFHTTIHDKEPLSLFLLEFEGYLEKAQESYGDEVPQHMQMLWEFFNSAEMFYQETGEEPVIFFY